MNGDANVVSAKDIIKIIPSGTTNDNPTDDAKDVSANDDIQCTTPGRLNDASIALIAAESSVTKRSVYIDDVQVEADNASSFKETSQSSLPPSKVQHPTTTADNLAFIAEAPILQAAENSYQIRVLDLDALDLSSVDNSSDDESGEDSQSSSDETNEMMEPMKSASKQRDNNTSEEKNKVVASTTKLTTPVIKKNDSLSKRDEGLPFREWYISKHIGEDKLTSPRKYVSGKDFRNNNRNRLLNPPPFDIADYVIGN
jgi:hypothetical protein